MSTLRSNANSAYYALDGIHEMLTDADGPDAQRAQTLERRLNTVLFSGPHTTERHEELVRRISEDVHDLHARLEVCTQIAV
jgi:hypothetical protein